MNRYASSALKFIAYSAAALVILLAVAVGLLRLMLPELPQYREQIRARASEAIGLDVDFGSLDARWRLNGPELIFSDVNLTDPVSGAGLLEAQEVSVGMALLRMLRERRLTVGRLGIAGTAVTVERTADGDLLVQGRSVRGPGEIAGIDLPRDVRVILRDVDFTYRDARSPAGPVRALLTGLEWNRSDSDEEVEARLEPSGALGRELWIAASRERRASSPGWDLYVEGSAIDLARLKALLPQAWPAPRAGVADIELWATLTDGGLRRATANLEAEGLAPSGTGDTAPYDVRARLEWALNDGGWLAALSDLRIERAGERRPDSFLQISAETDPDSGLEALDVQSGFVSMADLRPLVAWLPSRFAGAFEEYDPTGDLISLSLRLEGLQQEVPLAYSVEAELRDVGIAPHGSVPGVRGLTGTLRADESNGRLAVDSGSLVLDAPDIFGEPLAFDRADATVVWRGVGNELSVLCDRLLLEDEWLTTESSFELDVPLGPESGSPRLDLTAEWRLRDISRTRRYLPVGVMSPAIVRWLEDALVAGRAERGSLRINGALADFPFDDGNGELRARASVRDAVLRFSGNWPDVEQLDAEVILEGMRLATSENSAVTMGSRFNDVYARFRDIRKGVLRIRGATTGTLGSVLEYVKAAPIAGLFGGRLDDVSADGPARVRLDLTLPTRAIEEYEFEARLSATEGSLALNGFPHPLTGLTGEVRMTRAGAQGDGIRGIFLDNPVSLELTPGGEDVAAVVVADGRVTAKALVEEAGVPLAGDLAGATDYQATLRFPRAGLESAPPVSIRVDSRLEGLAVTLPDPAWKPAEESWPFSVEIVFPGPGMLGVTGFYGQTAKWSLETARGETGWKLERGNVHLGPGLPAMPTGSGLYLTGRLERLRLGDWLERANAGGSAPGEGTAGGTLRAAKLSIGDLFAFGQRVRNVELEVERNASDWLVQAEAETISGSVIVPTDLGSGRPLVLDMERLHLVEADPRAGGAGSPAGYPPLDIRIADFRIGQRGFGAVGATFRNSGSGILSDDLSANAATFSFRGAAGWVADVTDPAGQRSSISGTLESTDVKATLSQLGYFPGINAEAASATLDLSFSGPPRAEFLGELDGDVSISIRNGQLDEVDPGAGRVVGLLSVAQLPRRLSLDFRDIFNRGLGFDKIEGTFRIVNGDAYTCDLSLEGSVADIGIVGRAGLAQRDYNQTALVSADVGSSLPAVGAVVAGPQAAAALLLFSQIFKKPLQELSQVYYQVSGDFDNPSIERADARRFAATSELAGCLNDRPRG